MLQPTASQDLWIWLLPKGSPSQLSKLDIFKLYFHVNAAVYLVYYQILSCYILLLTECVEKIEQLPHLMLDRLGIPTGNLHSWWIRF